MFLQGAGKTILAIPFLPSLLPSTAKAATAPSKYLHINSSWAIPRFTTQPLFQNPWPAYPQVAGTNPNSIAWIQKDADTKYQSLKAIIDYQGKISWTLNEAWNPFANRMNLVTNAHAYVYDNKFNSSVSSTASSGPGKLGWPNANGPNVGYAYSVDYLVEKALTASSPIPALRVHLRGTNSEADIFGGFCYGTENGVEKKFPMAANLTELKQALSGKTQSSTPASVSRRSLIDAVLGDYNSLINNRRTSQLDKQRLNEAVELWHQVEKRGSTCGEPNFGTTQSNWTQTHQAGMDAVVWALACGLTRNVSYGLIQGGDNIESIPGTGDTRVPGAGDPAITDPYYGTVRWRSNQVASFLSKLDAAKDENGNSLLDSTLTVWAHCTGNANHGMLGHSLIVVGGNGKLDLGWHVDAGAAPVNRFHITNMRALGLSQADIERNGRAGFGEYADNIVASAGGSVIQEHDGKSNDPSRLYDVSKRAYFFQESEKRKAFSYLK